MRAVVSDGRGELQSTEQPMPEPDPGQVRIAVAAAAVNPVDVATRNGMLHTGAVPEGTIVGIGWDVSGVVDAVAEFILQPR